MKRRIPSILGALLGLMCMALLFGCIGHSTNGTGIPGERADHRACAIAFARENRSVLRNAARVLNKLRPAPKLVYLEDGPEDWYIMANYGIGGDVQLTDPELQDALLPDPWGKLTTGLHITHAIKEGPGWRFLMSCSDEFLDTGHDYTLLWSPSDPTPGDGWTACGAGRERHDRDTDEYVENIGRNVFYSYTFYH